MRRGVATESLRPDERPSLGSRRDDHGQGKGGRAGLVRRAIYHHPTRFVVIDLKVGPFRAEFAGKMNLYVNAVNELIAHDTDRATGGFILSTDRDKTVA